MTRFFIKHPVIAIVLNTLIIFAGILAYKNLDLREYPAVIIPEFTIQTYYQNGNQAYLESMVTNPIEDQLMNIDGLEHITSETWTKHCEIKVRFKEGTNTEAAQMGIRESIAKAYLPKDIKAPQIFQRGKNENNIPFFLIGLSSNQHTTGQLTHYANCHIRDSIRGLEGVSNTTVLGLAYTMRIQLLSSKLYAQNIDPIQTYFNISKALDIQAVGTLNDLYPISIENCLNTPNAFQELLIPSKNHSQTKNFKLFSIANVQETAENPYFRFHHQGKPGVGIEMHITSNANPLHVSNEIQTLITKLQNQLPKGMHFKKLMDQGEFIRNSLNQLRNSFFETIFLVMIIVSFCLNSFRLSLIPLVTIPISLIGSLCILAALGYSLNTLTLLGIILAIGLVVDDTIIMVEHIISHNEKGLSALKAAEVGASKITFAIIAMTLTLACVYIPIFFQKGIIGQLFAEFAVSITAAVLISGFTSLSLAPWLTATILTAKKNLNNNFSFVEKTQQFYENLLKKMIKIPNIWSIWSFISISILCSVLYINSTFELAPIEDRNFVGLWVPSPQGSTIDDKEVMAKTTDQLLNQIPSIQERIGFIFGGGFSICGVLPPPGNRPHSKDLEKQIQAMADKTLPFQAYAWSLNSGLPGINNFENNVLEVTLKSTQSIETLVETAQKIAKKIRQLTQTEYCRILPTGQIITKQAVIHPFVKQQLQLSDGDLATALGLATSGKELTYFKDNQPYQVLITIAGKDPLQLSIPISGKGSVPLSNLIELQTKIIYEPIMHEKKQRAVSFKISYKEGTNISDFSKSVEQIFHQTITPADQFNWGQTQKETIEAKYHMQMLFIAACLFIYAILCMQFENFFDPLLILITAPLGLLGGLLWATISGQSLNIFSQIGLITLIGLITKHGILLIDVANQKYSEKKDWEHAFYYAAISRFRPIMMTTLAMVLGCIPLYISSSSGYEIRRAIAGVLLGGLAFGTIGTLILLPTLGAIYKKGIFLKEFLHGNHIVLKKLHKYIHHYYKQIPFFKNNAP